MEALKCFGAFHVLEDSAVYPDNTDRRTVVFADECNATHALELAENHDILIGLLFKYFPDNFCTLIGNTKPEYIILYDDLMEDLNYLSKAVRHHRMYYNDTVMRRLLGNAQYKPRPEDYRLTQRQVAAYRAYVKAGDIKGAAKISGLSEYTISEHIKNIKNRLGITAHAQIAHIFTSFEWLEKDLVSITSKAKDTLS
jgi:DNA-binding NarL/FixJ family response regulator